MAILGVSPGPAPLTGVWTPSLGGNTTYTTQSGTYIKIGKLVYASFIITVNILGTGSPLQISGLPFAGASPTAQEGGAITYFLSLATAVMWIIPTVAATFINLGATTAAQASIGTAVNIFGNGARLEGFVIYQTSV